MVCFVFTQLWAQAAYVSPVPTNVNNWLKFMLMSLNLIVIAQIYKTQMRKIPIYMWTWSPSEPVVGNGIWESSNEDMRMQQDADNPNLWLWK